jgi:hypothetical protein
MAIHEKESAKTLTDTAYNELGERIGDGVSQKHRPRFEIEAMKSTFPWKCRASRPSDQCALRKTRHLHTHVLLRIDRSTAFYPTQIRLPNLRESMMTLILTLLKLSGPQSTARTRTDRCGLSIRRSSFQSFLIIISLLGSKQTR